MITLKLAVRTITMKFSRYVLLCIVFFVSTIALIFNFIGAHAIKNSMEGACIRIFTGNVMVKNVEYDYRLGLASSGDPKLVEHVADYIEAYEKEEGVTGCVARVRRGVQVTSEKTEYMNLIGVDTDREVKYSEFKVREGKVTMKSGEAIISKTCLDRMDLTIGDNVYINMVSAQGIPMRKEYEIVGVIDNTNRNFLRQDEIYIPYQDALDLLQMEDVATELLVYTKDKTPSDEQLTTFNKIAKDKDIKAYPWVEIGNEIIYASLGAYAAILFLAIACAVIICALVYNLTSMSIYSQIRMIGTMLALGMTHGKVLVKFICENLLVGLLSCGLSAVLAILGIQAMSSRQIPLGVAAEIFGNDYLTLHIDYRVIFLVALSVAFFSIISTLIAFCKIRSIQPIEAIIQ